MSPPKPWKRLGRDREADYRILKIRDERAVNPRNETEHRLTLVECPDWVNVIAVTSDGQLIFVRQFRFGIWANTLEIPGGSLEPGEAPAAAAARELEEETGYRAGRLAATRSWRWTARRSTRAGKTRARTSPWSCTAARTCRGCSAAR
jgi:ADP-ribose pyrophosphatase